ALYDMKKDPGQKVNIALQKPGVVKKMRDAYKSFWKEARPLMVNEKVPMSRTRPYHVWYREQIDNGGIPDWEVPKL
ncbi:MAG: arylsulfatase, partial [Verrucomicrobiota bacterium]|nr:arylsulfatase [Verrucomicrobiota bacterium]